jgi:hypothetical protein
MTTLRQSEGNVRPPRPSIRAGVLVAAEIALAAAGTVYFAIARQHARDGVRNVTIALALIVALGTAIAVGYRRMRRRQAEFIAIANAAIRDVASRVGLDQVSESPGGSRSDPWGNGFVEARGIVCGVRVSLFIDAWSLDEMRTVLLFPEAVPSQSTIEGLGALAKRLPHERGLMLALRPPSTLFGGVEPCVETNVSRIVAVVDRAIDLLTSDARNRASR